MADHYFHHHIEDGGLLWITLCDASLSAEGFSVVPSCPGHHIYLIPIPAREAEVPGTHAIYLRDVHAPGPVQGIVCLVQFQ